MREDEPPDLAVSMQVRVGLPVEDAADRIEAEHAVPKLQDIGRLPNELPLEGGDKEFVFTKKLYDFFDLQVLGPNVAGQV